MLSPSYCFPYYCQTFECSLRIHGIVYTHLEQGPRGIKTSVAHNSY